LCRAVIRFSNDGAQVEVERAKISSGNHAVRTSIERIASRDCGVDNLGHLTGRRVVVESHLHHRGKYMSDLLLSETKGRHTHNNTIVLLTPALNLTDALSSTIRASLIIGVNLGISIQALESSCQRFADDRHLTQSLVSKHIGRIPIDCSVSVQVDLVELTPFKASYPALVAPPTAPYWMPPVESDEIEKPPPPAT
jgi:hypothetical protein